MRSIRPLLFGLAWGAELLGCTGTTLFTNFGPSYCAQNSPIHADDCINQNLVPICGSAAGANCPFTTGNGVSTGPVAYAASFTVSGATAQLQLINLPLSLMSGTNSFQISIAADAGGKPGAALESYSVTAPQYALPVQAPNVHIYSSTHPSLASGATYWLVVLPGSSTTVGVWNNSAGDTPTATDFLISTAAGPNGVPTLAGPWASTSNLLRPAFQVNVQ